MRWFGSWQGVSSSTETYMSFTGNDGIDAQDGQPVNCSVLATSDIWGTGSLGFNSDIWDFSHVDEGRLPTLRAFANGSNADGDQGLLTINYSLLTEPKAFRCMTTLTTNDLTAGIIAINNVLVSTLASNDVNAQVARYPANFNLYLILLLQLLV